MRTKLIALTVVACLAFATTAEARPKPLRWLFGKAKAVAGKVAPRGACGSSAKASKAPAACAGGHCAK